MAEPSDPLAHRNDLGEALDIAHQAALAYDLKECERIVDKYEDARTKRFQLLFVK